MNKDQPYSSALYSIIQHGTHHHFVCNNQAMPIEELLLLVKNHAQNMEATIVESIEAFSIDADSRNQQGHKVFCRIPSHDALELSFNMGYSLLLDYEATIDLDVGTYEIYHNPEYCICEMAEGTFPISEEVVSYAIEVRAKHEMMPTLGQLMASPLPEGTRLVSDYGDTLYHAGGHSVAELTEYGHKQWADVLGAHVKNTMADEDGKILTLTDVDDYWLYRFTNVLGGNAYYYDCKVYLVGFGENTPADAQCLQEHEEVSDSLELGQMM